MTKKEQIHLCLEKNRWKNLTYMAFPSYNESLESELVNIVFKRDKLQHLNINQSKLQVKYSYKRDEKIATDFEPIIKEHVINKAYLDEKLSKTNGRLTILGKNYNQFLLNCNEQSVEEILIQRTVKTTIQILYNNSFLVIFKVLMR